MKYNIIIIVLFLIYGCHTPEKQRETKTVTTEEGHLYVGQMLNGVKDGQGSMTYSFGRKYKYTGAWKMTSDMVKV